MSENYTYLDISNGIKNDDQTIMDWIYQNPEKFCSRENKNCCFGDISGLAAKYGRLKLLELCYKYQPEDCSFNEGGPFNDCEILWAISGEQYESFEFLYSVWKDKQKFWNSLYIHYFPRNDGLVNTQFDMKKFKHIINQINLDKDVWKSLFTLNLNDHPYLKLKVEIYKIESSIIQLKDLINSIIE